MESFVPDQGEEKMANRSIARPEYKDNRGSKHSNFIKRPLINNLH